MKHKIKISIIICILLISTVFYVPSITIADQYNPQTTLTTTVDSISPYIVNISLLNITTQKTAGDLELDSSQLYFRYSADNTTNWSSWTKYNRQLTIDPDNFTASSSWWSGGVMSEPANLSVSRPLEWTWITNKGGSGMTEWVDYDIGYPLCSCGYALVSTGGQPHWAPKAWTFEGRNETDEPWEIIDTQSDQTGWTSNQLRQFPQDEVIYRYYRLNITESNHGSRTAIARWIIACGEEDIPEWNFCFHHGVGYYEFYSIGTNTTESYTESQSDKNTSGAEAIAHFTFETQESNPQGYTELYTIDDLYDIRHNLSDNYILMNDLDFQNNSDYVDWTVSKNENTTGTGWLPIGNWTTPFTGIFDGQNYSITNLTINRPLDIDIGLFGYAQNATFKNIILVNPDVRGDMYIGTLTGYGGNTTIDNCQAIQYGGYFGYVESDWGYIGGLAGIIDFYSSIDKCFTNVSIFTESDTAGGIVGVLSTYSTINNSSSADPSYYISYIYAEDYAGGLAGRLFDNASINNSYSTRNVEADYYAGGLVGLSSNSHINNSYATGNTTVVYDDAGGLIGENLGTIERCYATGNVSGDDYIGGFVGHNDGIINTSYSSTGNVSGEYAVGGFVGYNTNNTKNCYARNNVTRLASTVNATAGFVGVNYQAEITNCYSTGKVIYIGDTNPTNRGFLGGFATGGNFYMYGNFFDSWTSLQDTSAGDTFGGSEIPIGLDTWDGMQEIDTYTNRSWNIEETYTQLNDGYPFLSWQIGNSPTWLISNSTVTMDIELTVWNGTAWTTTYPEASLSEILQFRLNSTIGNLYAGNVTFDLFHIDNLKTPILGTSNITFPNTTKVQREPNVTFYPYWFSSCGNGYYTSLWNLTEEESNLTTPSNNFTITFNMSYDSLNFSVLQAAVYEDTFTNYVESNFVYIGEQFNTSITCSPGNETSKWIVSEHGNRSCTPGNCFDEVWHKYESIQGLWNIINSTHLLGTDWGWVIDYNNYYFPYYTLTSDNDSLSYMIANDSSINRTSGYLRMRYTYDEPYEEEGEEEEFNPDSEPFIGIIYAYEDNNNYDMFFYSLFTLLFLSKEDGVLVNTNDSTPVTNASTAYNYYDLAYSWYLDPYYDWEYDSGILSKHIYNEHTGNIKVKTWEHGELEPGGWLYEGNLSSSTHPTSPIIHNESKCFGVVTWNPDGWLIDAQFDNINIWRLNYTTTFNTSAVENHTTLFNDGVPLMHFKAFNETDYDDFYYDFEEHFIDYWFDGTLTAQEYMDKIFCSYRNGSTLFNMESRYSNTSYATEGFGPMGPVGESTTYQNDTIYYYSGIRANIEEWYTKNQLILSIQDTTDGTLSDYDGALIAIDVDNNQQWDDNDLLIYWWYDSLAVFGISYKVFNGTTLSEGGEYLWGSDIDLNIVQANHSGVWWWQYYSWLPALHRLGEHVMYEVAIPFFMLEKESVGSGNYLSENDTFGLHIMTTPTGFYFDTPIDVGIVWENYNESNDSTYTSEYNIDSWATYLNITNGTELSDFFWLDQWNGVNSTHMQYWGIGQIGYEVGEIIEVMRSINFTKECNITLINNLTITHNISYIFNITNDGEATVTNVTVNDTFPSGLTMNSCSLPGTNITDFGNNTYLFNVTSSLDALAEITFYVNFTVPINYAQNGTTVTNDANATSDQQTYRESSVSFQYGSNNAPRIIWQYPVNLNTSTPLLLANISVGVVDDDGDQMDVYFYTNKSEPDSWNPVWNAIGSNLSVNNGTYLSNQTFNFSGTHNTRWRWGNTTYYWSINITDGKIWTNESYSFKTTSSRYDVDNVNGVVNVFDLSAAWSYRTPTNAYLGVYDVDANTAVNVFDLSAIWAYRT